MCLDYSSFMYIMIFNKIVYDYWLLKKKTIKKTIILSEIEK